MKLSELDLAAMEDRSKPNRWGAGNPAHDRRVYYLDGKWYKVWDAEYIRWQSYVSNGKHVDIGPPLNNELLGFRVGYFDSVTAPALIDFIHDDNGVLRGYVTRAGIVVDPIPPEFARTCANRAIETGWVFADFGVNNVIEVDDQLSLVDFDSHFCELKTLDVGYERSQGCLKPEYQPDYVRMIEERVAEMRTLKTVRGSARVSPPVGGVNFGDLDRLSPVGTKWGEDRGRSIDRYYVNRFVKAHGKDIRGHVLEIGDSDYTEAYGSPEVRKVDVLHIDPDAGASITGDLANLPYVPDNTFDCIVLTQVMQLVYNVKEAVETCHRILRPGGTVLATMPGVSHVLRDAEDERKGNVTWSWSFTKYSLERMFGDVFGAANVWVESNGNVLATLSFLQGLAVEDLSESDLRYRDENFDFVLTVRAVKADSQIPPDRQH